MPPPPGGEGSAADKEAKDKADAEVRTGVGFGGEEE